MHRFMLALLLLVSVVLSTAISPVALAGTNGTIPVRPAVPRVLTPSSPPRALDVNNSIVNWANSVNTVNDYLNNPQNSTKLQDAILFAKDEPVQLATLMKTTNLSQAGVKSALVLMGNFPSIVSNLNSVQKETMSVADGTAAINFMRCCTVLPAINTLWSEATSATQVAAADPPNRQQQCSQMTCSTGVSGNGNATAVVSN